MQDSGCLIRNGNCLHFSSNCIHPRFFGGVCVAHHFSYLCWFFLCLFVFVVSYVFVFICLRCVLCFVFVCLRCVLCFCVYLSSLCLMFLCLFVFVVSYVSRVSGLSIIDTHFVFIELLFLAKATTFKL
jgi:hypothetical protein